MRAVILVGHGSLRPGSGSAMIRLAARMREIGAVPLVAVGFLNYSRPSFTEALARIVARGATEVVVQPYFLIPGKFVRIDIAKHIEIAANEHPYVQFALAEPLGDHPILADLVLQRAQRASTPSAYPTALLMIAHGSPDPQSNQPIEAVAERVRATGTYALVAVCYLSLNHPSINTAIDDLVSRGIVSIDAVPYFLQMGSHVAEDVPNVIAFARTKQPNVLITLAEYLGYDRCLAQVLAQRVQEASTHIAASTRSCTATPRSAAVS